MPPLLRRILREFVLVLAAVAAIAIVLVSYVAAAWDRPVQRPVVPMAAARTPEAVARGEHLYQRSALCWTCHGSEGSRSPTEPQAGGREFDLTGVGPGFGYYYGSNVTPDGDTGIGAWTDGEIVRAIREGVNRQGRVIFPVMAYPFYHGMGDEDALAIVAYLRSLRPVNHAVPRVRPSFAAKALITFGLISPEAAITEARPVPARGRTAQYGEYLAWHAAGCAECHTPRDPRNGKVDPSRPMGGGLFPFPEEGIETAGSNLTPDAATGIGGWTEAQFMTAVRNGVRPDGTVMLPFMPWPWYGHWSDEELGAIWLYLRSVTPVSHTVARGRPTGAAAGEKGLPRGRALYGVYCADCHGAQGRGGPLTETPLREMAGSIEPDGLAAFIREGVAGTAMPAFGKTLTADQMADLAAFITSLPDRR